MLILTLAQLRAVIRKRPKGFGDHRKTYHSDAVFLIDIDPKTAMKVFDPRPGVDEVWPGTGVIYSQRLSAQRTRSRLGKIVGTPVYQSMTIRRLADDDGAARANGGPRGRVLIVVHELDPGPLPCPRIGPIDRSNLGCGRDVRVHVEHVVGVPVRFRAARRASFASP